MMKIESLERMLVEIPMRYSVQHHLAERSVARNVLVAAEDEMGNRGWGECCPREYVTGETLQTVKRTLDRKLMPNLRGRVFDGFFEAAGFLEKLSETIPRNELAAFCALELAVLDLAGQRFQVSAGRLLGPILREEVLYSGIIAADTPSRVKAMAEAVRRFGFSQVKVKLGADIEKNRAVLSAVRHILGDAVSLRIDANAAWSGAEALRQLKAFSPFDLAGVEQPVPAEDIEGMKQVTAAGLIPVVADESLCAMEDGRRLIDEKACDIFNIRVSKCGGLINSGRLHRLATEAGLKCQLGAQVGETGILSAAGRHFAARCEGLVWAEGSFGSLLLEQDIAEPEIVFGAKGRAPAMDFPGLGIRISADRVKNRLRDF